SVKAMTLSSSRPWTQITPSSGSISRATSKRMSTSSPSSFAANRLDVRDLVDVHGSRRERCDGARQGPPVPRQQLIEPMRGMGGDAREDIGEPGLGIDAVHLCRDDEAVHVCGTPTSAIGSAE